MADATDSRKDRRATIAENAARAFAEHVVTVEHEHGLYRHYRCAKPGTGNYAFHVVTFPGRLIVSGDIGDMAWSRCPDMIEWAAGAVESIGYFAEKVWGSIPTEEWCEDTAREVIAEEYKNALEDTQGLEADELAEATEKANEIKDELLRSLDEGEHSFATAYYESDWYGGDFPNVRDFTAEYLWCREAVCWFLRWYAANRKPVNSGVPS
jgi:hypothetical protein